MQNNDKKYFYNSVPQDSRVDADPQAKQVAQQIINKFEEEKALGKTVNDIKSDVILNEERNAMEMNNRSTLNDTQLRMYGSEEHNTVMVEFADRQGNVADEIVSSNTPPGITDRAAYYDNMEPLTGTTFTGTNQFDENSSVDSAVNVSPTNRYHSPSSYEDTQESNDQMNEGSSSYNSSGYGSGSEQGNIQQIANPNINNNNNNNNNDNNNSSVMQVNETGITEQDLEKSEKSSDSVKSPSDEPTTSHKRKRDEDSDSDNANNNPSKRIDIENYLMDPGSDIIDFSGD